VAIGGVLGRGEKYVPMVVGKIDSVIGRQRHVVSGVHGGAGGAGGGWGLSSDVLVGLICGVLGNSRSWRAGSIVQLY
jgi:hypothetical protein